MYKPWASHQSVFPDVNTDQSLRAAPRFISSREHTTKWVFVSREIITGKDQSGSFIPTDGKFQHLRHLITICPHSICTWTEEQHTQPVIWPHGRNNDMPAVTEIHRHFKAFHDVYTHESIGWNDCNVIVLRHILHPLLVIIFCCQFAFCHVSESEWTLVPSHLITINFRSHYISRAQWDQFWE